VYFDRFIITIHHSEVAPTLAVVFDDGSITFLNQVSMQNLALQQDTNMISSMPQAGFNFPLGASGLQAAISPNLCAAIILDADAELHLRFMEHSYVFDEGRHSAAISALTLSFARSCGRSLMNEDVLVIVHQQLTQDTQNLFISESLRALNLNVDFAADQEKVIRNATIPKCLSVHSALGFKSFNRLRSTPAQVSWITMNLRAFSVLFTYLYHSSTSKSGEDYAKPAVMRTLHGLVKWAVETIKFILDEMFELSDQFKSRPIDPTELFQAGKMVSYLESESNLLNYLTNQH
jgi:mediator of RNA polymerase II transcription subunit 16